MTAGIALAVAMAGCNASTNAPQPTNSPAPTATPAAADTPTLEPTAEATTAETPAPTPSPEATATPTATPAPTPTPTPTPTPAPTLNSAVAPCTGSAAIKQTWANLIPKFKFHLYCAVLPSGWQVVSMSWDYKAAGMQAHYKTKSGMTIDVWEGTVCALSPNPCTGYWPDDFGTQSFGGLTGDMFGEASTKHWTTIVHTGVTTGYTLLGHGMTESAYRAISAAMHKIS
jgi:hypothetical protein